VPHPPSDPAGRQLARTFRALAALLAVAVLAPAAAAQLRLATWNISNYAGGRDLDLRNAIYAVYNGRSMAPDVFTTQEFTSSAAVAAFLAILNSAPGSPGDWAAAPFIDGPDTDSAFFYRTTRVTYLGTTIVALGSSDLNNQPRNTYRYDIRLLGYLAPSASLGIYSVHFKAQGGTNDAGRRLVEAQRIRDNAQGIDTNGPGSGLPAGFLFLLAGDTNIQTSSEAAYAELVGSQPDNSGRFFDPINSPGVWNNNFAFRFIHTQDPAGAGGMDDRHDQVLIAGALRDQSALDYIGSPTLPYSTTTWNDPNHSYRAWGNDGTSFNLTLTTAGNSMVGPSIAQSLINACAGSGHLPVFLDFRVPGTLGPTPATIDVGTLPLNATASVTLTIANDADTSLWTEAGVSDLLYSLATSGDLATAPGPFAEPATPGPNQHQIAIDTASPGPVTGLVTITSNDPDEPVRLVAVTGQVVAPPACPADVNADGLVTTADVSAFLSAWFASISAGTLQGDFNADGVVTTGDVTSFLQAWFNAIAAGGC